MTNTGGEYYGIRSTIRITAYQDHLQIGIETVTYEKVLQIQLKGEILFIQFIDSKGKSIEGYLKYNTFLPSTAKKQLRELVNTVQHLIPKRTVNSNGISSAVLASQVKIDSIHTEVIINSSKVSFPPFCPVCFNPASKVAKFEVTSMVPSSDFFKIGFWLIPVCYVHKNITGQIKVKNWSPSSSEISFTFRNKLYAEAFLKLNQTPINQRFLNSRLTIENINKLRNFKFIIYEYYVSALVFSFLNLSDVQELKSDESNFIRGLKYNAITLTAGWWSFPFGQIYTLIVLFKNIYGGNDITERVVEVYRGKAFSALDD